MSNSIPLPASEFVLRSFNLLDKTIASDLTKITNNLKDIRISPLPADYYETYINEQLTQPQDNADFKVYTSNQASYESVSASFGLSGSYGFYSGSVKASTSLQKYRAATAFNSSCVGTVNVGTTSYSKAISKDILNLFNPEFVDALKGINSLQTAKSFIDTYGTHIALGWNLGGSFSIQIQSGTSTYADQTKVSVAVTAAYNGVANVSASASAAYQLNQSGDSSSYEKEITTIGGSAADAGKINLTKQDSGIDKWVGSCTNQTTYGLFKSLTMAEIANQTGNTVAGTWLQNYMDLAILAYSLQNPTILTSKTATIPYISNETSATAPANYKIISGGAAVQMDSNSFLTGSFPEVINSGGENVINGWQVMSHDCMNPASSSDYLTAYAIAVYDPGDLLKVKVIATEGTNLNIGFDKAIASLDNDYTLVGGGCQTKIISGQASKFILSNSPYTGTSSDYTSWLSSVSDYNAAANASLTTYAIGIKSGGLKLTQTVLANPSSGMQSHGNQTSTLGGGINVIGGGVYLGSITQSNNNLTQKTYPSSDNAWTEYNKDLNGLVSPVEATSYAIGVTASILGLTGIPTMLIQE